MKHVLRTSSRFAGLLASAAVLVIGIGAWTRPSAGPHRAGDTAAPPARGDVLRGRASTIRHDCGGCHGGFGNPAAQGWLAGTTSPDMEFKIGPCYVTPGAQPCFTTRPRNLTPDNATGLGRFTERQIFNALRYGLRPGETPDVEITSRTPGQGNFPEHPKYLAPPMPWTSWRYMSDQELWDIAAYLKRGLKPVVNRVADSEGPPDFWAAEAADPKYGTYPVAPFPTANERRP
jgi:mono/diheme cytochrome c family protein